MKLWSNSFENGASIPGEFAFAVPASQGHIALSTNRNPHFEWSEVPATAKSLVLICHDPDVPSRGDDVNQEGRSIPADLPRVDFFHWLLVDLPADMHGIAPGAFSEGIAPHGKSGPATGMEARQGLNDYTGWFAGDAAMTGQYFGYDGPCPPWNDSIPHRYVFTLYALDIARTPLEGAFTGTELRAAIAGHVLAEASFVGRYSLNPAVKTS